MTRIIQFPTTPNENALEAIPPFAPTIEYSATSLVLADTSATQVGTIEIDPELTRVYIALDYSSPILLYWIAHQMTARSNGSGVVGQDELLQEVKRLGIATSPEVIKRHWLAKGDGIFWKPRSKGKIGITAYPKLCAIAIELALAQGKPELVNTNPPGTKFIAVPVAKTRTGWCGNALAAWHNSRDGHTQNISRFTLNKLWGTTTKTLIEWEGQAGITVKKGYAIYTDGSIPKHAFPVVTATAQGNGNRTAHICPMGRHSNIYNVPSLRQKQHKRVPGEARRVARRKLEELASGNTPDSTCGQPRAQANGVGFGSTKRRNFYATDGDLSNAFKRLAHHLHSDPEDYAPHFVQLGWDAKQDRWLYEQNSDGVRRIYSRELVKGEEAEQFLELHGGRQAIVNQWRKYAA